MELVISFPDEQQDRVLGALCAIGGYKDTVLVPTVEELKDDDGKVAAKRTVNKPEPNPVSRKEFAKGFVIKYIRKEIVRHETAAGQKGVAEAVRASVDEIALT